MDNHSDVTPLADALPLMPRETAFSYVSRLAAFYGCQSAGQFCDDFGISLPKLMDGDGGSLNHLALLTGSEPAELHRWSAKSAQAGYRSVNSQMVDVTKSSRRSWSFCIECAEEDIAANPDIPADIAIYARAEWQTSFVRTCEKHKVRMRSYSVRSRSAISDLGNFVAKFMVELGSKEGQPATPGPMELYILARLLGRHHAPVPLLDDLNLSQVVSICRSMGASIEGDTAPAADWSQDRLDLVETRGFQALFHGDVGLLAACREIRERHWAKANRGGCFQRIAVTLQIFRNVAAMRAVAEAIAKAIFLCFPFNSGEKQLGIACKETVLMRSHGARLELGISAQIWEMFVDAKPQWIAFTDGDPARTVVDIKAAREYFAGKLPFTSLRSFAQEQGVPYRHVETLKDSGLIQPTRFPGIEDSRPIYSLPELRAAMQSIANPVLAANDNQVPDGFVSLSALCRAHPVELSRIRKLVHSGELPFVNSSAAKNPNDQIWVNLKSALAKAFDIPEAVEITDAATELRLNVNVLRLLAHTGTIPAVSRPWRGGTYYVFTRADLDAFRARYIFPTEMAERGIQIGLVRAVGKVSHPTWRAAPVRMYLRSEAERAA